MTVTRRLAPLAVALAGLAVMGADPAPSPRPAQWPPLPVTPLSHEALAAKLLPTPRLFKMEVTRQDPAMSETTLMCMGAEAMRAALGGAEARRERAPAAAETAARATGCTQSLTKTTDGWTRIERVCDKAAGAAQTSHMTTEFRGEMNTDFRTRVKMQTEAGGTTSTFVQESHTTMLGACPADLKPGQMRLADGRVVAFGGTFAAAARPSAPNP